MIHFSPPAYVSGRVRQGYKQGRLLGLPTANLRVKRSLALPEGVYVGYTRVSPEITMYPSLIFWGRPHTLPHALEPRLEVHLLAQHVDLYGRLLGVTITDFFRENKIFNTEADLRAAIREDLARAFSYFHLS